MTTHKIDIEGLPEGWEPVAYRIPADGERVLSGNDGVIMAKCINFPCLIVQKTNPRRIVLKEISRQEARVGDYVMSSYQVLSPVGARGFIDRDTFWRIKEE